MDVEGYAERAAVLVNASVRHVDDLRALLVTRPELREAAGERDCLLVRRLQRELLPVFAAAAAGEGRAVLAGLDELLLAHPVTPRITAGDDGPRLRVGSRGGSVGEQLVGESLLGLATLACELGPSRLGTCAEPRCERVWVDTSPNHSRRYCSERCASRAHVAAHRARRRTTAGGAGRPGPA